MKGDEIEHRLAWGIPFPAPDERQAGLRETLEYVSDAFARHREGRLGPTGVSAALSHAERGLRAALAAQVPAQEERLDVERWADELALVIAKARFGPGVDMGGRHNPKPSEVTAARRFMEGVAANPSADPDYGRREYEKVRARRALAPDPQDDGGGRP